MSAARRIGIGKANGVRCRHARERQIAGVDIAAQQGKGQLGCAGEGAADIERNAFNADPQGHVGRGLGKPGVDDHGVGFGVGQGDVERQPLHQRHFEVFEFIPQRVVDVQGVDRPLEGRANPQFGRHGNQSTAQLDAPSFALGGQAAQGERHGEVVGAVPINVHVVFEKNQVGSHQQFTREGARIPGFVGRPVVPGGEVDVDGVGVDANAQQIVKAEVLHRKQGLPQVVGPSLGMRGDIDEELVRPRVVDFKRRGVAKFNLVKVTFSVCKSIAGAHLTLGGVEKSERGLGPLQGDKRLAFRCTIGQQRRIRIQHTEVVSGNRSVS